MSFAETFQKLLRIPDQGAAKNDVSSFRRWVPAVTPAPKPPEPDIGAAAASFVDRLSKFAEVVCPECGKKPGKYKIQGDAITCGQCSATSDMEKWEKGAEKNQKVYAVDLDGTLAHHAGEFDPEVVGEPVEAMMKRVKKWIADGHTVKIFTARAATESNIPPVRKWLKKHGLGDLEITNEKTPDMNFFVDDKAVAISRNKGTTTHRKLADGFPVPAPMPNVSPEQAVSGIKSPIYGGDKMPMMKLLSGRAAEARVRAWKNKNENLSEQIWEHQNALGRLPPTQNALVPLKPRGGFNPPSLGRVEPGWFKIPHYGKSFNSELHAANRYRSENPHLFRYEKAPDWKGPFEVLHHSLAGTMGGGGAVTNNGTGNTVNLGTPAPTFFRQIGGPMSLLKHESYHAALEPRDVAPAANVREKFRFINPGQKDVSEATHTDLLMKQILSKDPLYHHDLAPAEMRNYMSGLQEHQFKATGSRFTTPEQYQNFIKGVPFGDPAKMDGFMKGIPPDPARMFQQLNRLKSSDPKSFDKIIDWQSKTIPGYVDAAPAAPPSIAKTAGISSYLKVLRDKFVEARKRVHLTPTKPQMEAGNYRKGHVWMQGLDITIENPKGSTRSGETKDGRKWTCTMAADYGDIRNFPRSRADGDNMDIFVGPHPTSEVVFVIDQYIDGEFDEHKCMCGFFTAKEAKDAYMNSFDDKWKGFGAITTLTMNQFKNWLRSKNTAEAIAGQDLSEYIKKAMLECESMEKQASARRNSRSEFREARNEAVASGKVPVDMPFYVNGSSCIVNAGDWHEKEQIKASMDLASEYFDHVKEENECGLPPGYVPVKLSDEAHRKARKLDREIKQAADNSWMPPMAASFFDSPMVSNSTVAIGSGALRGALVAALIHGMRTLKRESQGENKRDLNLTRDLMLGAGIGAGSGALLHWVPDMAGAIHSATTPKAAHIMDIPLAPLSMGGMAAPIIGTGYGAIAGLAGGIGTKIKKKITGEPEYEGELIDSMLDGAQKGLGISSIAAASGTSTANSPAAAAPVRPQRKGRLVRGDFPAYVRK